MMPTPPKVACLLLALIGWLATSCVDEVQLPIRNPTRQLVVEGTITNEPPPYSVKLTYSGAFQSANRLPEESYVGQATVTLGDDLGRTVSLLPRGPGIYQTTDSSFVGTVGRTYTLRVALPDGKRYASRPEQMRSVPSIDSLSFAFVDVNVNANPERFNGYEVYTHFQDPAETDNYYRWLAYGYSQVHSTGAPCSLGNPNICFDYCWQANYTSAVRILSDALVNGNRITRQPVFFSPIYTRGPHLVEVSQLSLTREAYQFWKLYQEQQTRVGSILDPLPAPIVGNIANADNPNELALGYFAASAVARRRFAIYDPNPRNINKIYATTEYLIRPGLCFQAFPGSTLERPPGW
ncbi:MAG: DUF4249 domain-containing protein [Ferruginibacter sp.]|nr:DUF4249 domain-containing protein [Cytophagales bacterium]